MTRREELAQETFACRCGREFTSRKGRGIHSRRSAGCELTPEQIRVNDRDANLRYNKANREHRTALQRAWIATEKGHAAAHSPKARALRVAAARRSRATPVGRARHLAHVSVADAIKSGKLVRQPCQSCGDPLSEGHHHAGYDRAHRLDVTWLCREHHRLAHRALLSDLGPDA